MEEDRGKLFLAGFDLEPAEKAILENLIKNYTYKISERTKYEWIRLRMKKSKKGKAFLHELKAEMKAGRIFTASSADYNLFSAASEVFEKLLNEVAHNIRTSRQRR